MIVRAAPTLYLSPLGSKFHKFLIPVFDSFYEELQLLDNEVYTYNRQLVFSNIERTWVGLFNNAVRRSFPKIPTMEEFSVHMGGSLYNRADYYVRFKGEMDFIFEAKHYEEKALQTEKPSQKADMEKWYEKILKQAERYYRRGKPGEYHENTYLVALVFAWIRHPNALKRAQAYMASSDIEKAEKDSCDFCQLYYMEAGKEQHGVWVYGRIRKA